MSASASGEGRAVVVTGGAGPAVGSGVTLAVARHGFRVTCSAMAVRIDTADPASVAEAMAAVVDAEGGVVHGLVNSAGIGLNALAADMEVEDFDRIIAIDLRGPWLCAKALIPAMVAAGGGSIVHIGSVHALATIPTQTAYAAAKAGLHGMARAIAADYGPQNIRCNVVNPGAVPSQEAYGDGSLPAKDYWIDYMVRRQQFLHHVINPLDIGNACAFLLGDEARSITAQSITVDAGMTKLLWSHTEEL
jgi:NAD(P)-dependent dehydrogenase (short-subunit alcohol dehydrogenase family)